MLMAGELFPGTTTFYREVYNARDTNSFGSVKIRWCDGLSVLLLAVLAAIVIIDKAFVYWKYARLPGPLLELVETYDFPWSNLEQQLTELDQRNYFQRFFRVAMDNRGKPVWWVESRAGDEAQLIEKALSRGLWVLETIVTAAPLLGLLGTITGMMHAFQPDRQQRFSGPNRSDRRRGPGADRDRDWVSSLPSLPCLRSISFHDGSRRCSMKWNAWERVW